MPDGNPSAPISTVRTNSFSPTTTGDCAARSAVLVAGSQPLVVIAIPVTKNRPEHALAKFLLLVTTRSDCPVGARSASRQRAQIIRSATAPERRMLAETCVDQFGAGSHSQY